MNAVDDNLTRPVEKGVLMFLISEKARHQKDITDINITFHRAVHKFDITPEEIEDIKRKAKRYVKF